MALLLLSTFMPQHAQLIYCIYVKCHTLSKHFVQCSNFKAKKVRIPLARAQTFGGCATNVYSQSLDFPQLILSKIQFSGGRSCQRKKGQRAVAGKFQFWLKTAPFFFA
jgi:hypothetical protein